MASVYFVARLETCKPWCISSLSIAVLQPVDHITMAALVLIR